MSNLININSMSMTSQEIADLVESRHDSVKRTIERLANQVVIVQPPLVDEPGTDSIGRTRNTQVYVFAGEQGKRDSIIVVAQLSPEFTARLVDRWQELEKQVEQRDPMEMLNDPTVLRQALLGYSEKVIALESQVQEQAPKVQAYERIADATGSMSLRETATTLKYPERKMIVWMQQNGWLYRRPGRGTLLGYAEKIKAGYLDHKVTLIHNDRTGEDETRESVRVTPLGLTVLAKKLDADIVPVPPISGFGSPPPQSYAQIRG